ncbi:hypothetical protein BGZ47_000409 [Haplosporangium gracile]|nr:hypothetical protein BGZ47_000409 [Haplosporangium gracile]
MPPQRQYTERQLLIRQYEEKFVQACEESAGYDPVMPLVYSQILSQLYASRYLKPRMRMPFSTVLRDQVLSRYAFDKFKNIIRLTPKQFDDLLALIQDHRVFRSLNPAHPQALGSSF